MSGAGQPLDPVQALARQQAGAGQIDPVQALAMGRMPPPSAVQVAAPNASPDYMEDMVRAIPGGVAKGVAGLVGTPSSVINLASNLGRKVVGRPWIPDEDPRAATFMGIPTVGQGEAALSAPTHGFYKPQTIPGQYTETAASFLPNAVAPSSLTQRLARVLIPAGTSETAGQLTAGTPLEPVARAVGALAGGVGEGFAEGAGARARGAAPSLDELQAAKEATYRAANNAGVVISPNSFQNFATDLGTNLTRNHVIQADIHPSTLSAINIIQDEAAAGAPISLERADAIRQAVNGAIEKAAGPNGSKTDLRLAMKVKGGLDDYLDSLGPQDVLSGDPQTAVPILRQARDIAQRQFKGEQIQKMMDLAANSASTNYSASGYEQALRVQFKNLNAQLIKNPSLANTYTDAEREAIQRVAEGGPVGNALRYIGKFSAHGPVSAGAGMGIGALLGHSVGAGGAEGGIAGAIAVPMIGEMGRAGATALTERNARLAAELMRRGAPPPTNTPSVVNSGLIPLLLSRGVGQ